MNELGEEVGELPPEALPALPGAVENAAVEGISGYMQPKNT